MKAEIDKTLRHEISELTDYDVAELNDTTPLPDIGFDSLDFLSVQVALKRKNKILLDISDFAATRIDNYGDFLNYLSCLKEDPAS